ncbi:hypothetical protein Rhe02_92860 [Rhizocola hellebori]|uniref:Glycosyltransferase n=1 Tax=Rhizocola hellebori TaxID=1392758 RepID=A0A8J3QHH4_9ACTN|nr:hypothetical protein [Rhizocola hellebori]GIH11219.1 hypothetical protein Rhe02_92860 [Rhizocola hellebori]
MHSRTSLWQVPETCGWNKYVEDGADAIAQLSWTILRPGVCQDVPTAAASQAWEGPTPAVVHVHWPEKLATALGSDKAVSLIRHLKQRGARVVQTIHNVAPHETAASQPWFQGMIDTLTDGVHFFSAEHELQARASRPGLPKACVIFPHPLYTSVPLTRVGCFGRIREYKRTADFASALLADPDLPVQLVVLGYADSQDTAERLRALADTDSRLLLQPEFVAAPDFEAAVASVDWVAMPYRSLHSSGVLVTALQAGRRLLSPKPLGGTELYGSYDAERWLVVDPWTDEAAVRALSRVIASSRAALGLPTWATAARELVSFYSALRARPPRMYPEES